MSLKSLLFTSHLLMLLVVLFSGVAEWLQGETGSMKPKDHAELFAGSTQLLDLSKGFLNDIDNKLAGHGSVDDEDVRVNLNA